ncbi:hypothetical protein HHL11_05005 [Ramlibacter sp. G-1-2-2]|uniref:Uncharacterized protein n=1 Tax=Ramlibacter agri TaxID=2728837 RepID=A0A848H0N6_9BURK|nr:hypothetical protein [Ramlibacter agri]NML43099.1 hypothetical protein [Ramlibacter agri]
MPNPSWKIWHTAGLFVIVVAILAGTRWLAETQHLMAGWYLSMLALVAFLFVCGHGITGRPLGALIDARNVMSLARFQMAAWTVLVLSGYLTAALSNIAIGSGTALDIAVPSELWLLMGISTTSLVASPLILSTKANQGADPGETMRTLERLDQQGDALGTVGAQGQLVINDSPARARLSDLFTGEEVGNAAHLDLARMQMFFFTLVTIAAYAAMLAHTFGLLAGKPVTELPAIGQGMVALIGISHAGYLVGKAVPHSKPGPVVASGPPVLP